MNRDLLKLVINPLYLPLWLLVGLLRLLVLLPFTWLMRLGKILGRIYSWFPGQAKAVIKVNIDLCFPEYTSEQKKRLLKKNYESMGIALIETFLAWWGPKKRLRSRVHVHNYEHYEKYKNEERGAIVIVPHLLSLEIVGSLLAKELGYTVMYRPHRKAYVEFFTRRHRKAHFVGALQNHDMKGMLRALKLGGKVLFLPDIDAGIKHSIFANFFNIKAATITGTSRLAKIANAQVVPISFYRRDDLSGYDFYFHPPLEAFPTNDLEKDATRVNDLLEKIIREKPEQYLWQYRRFRTRPQGESRIYASSRRHSRR